MPLFSAVPGALRWEEVWDLLRSGVRENELLDYKEYPGLTAFQGDKNKRVLRTMAAMANTHGGAIIYGVAELKKGGSGTGAPDVLAGLKGIPAADVAKVQHSIEEQNWTLVPPIQGLTVEPVEVDSTVAPSGAADSVLLVIRLPRSDAAPHFIPGFGHYGRVGSHNGPFDDVPLSTGWFERLLRNRERSRASLRGILAFLDGIEGTQVWHKVWCAPRYPWKPLWRDLDGAALEALCPRILDPARGGTAVLPFQHRVNAVVSSRPVQFGWLWQAREAAGVALLKPIVPGRPEGVEQCYPFCTYLADERGVVALKRLSRAEVGFTRGTTGLLVLPQWFSPGFDWAYITSGLLSVVGHAHRLYEQVGYVGEVEFGVEVGVDMTRFAGIASVATSIGLSNTDYPVWQESLSSLAPGVSLLMAAPGGVVADADVALSRDLAEAVLTTPLHRRWVRAFGYAPGEAETTAFVGAIRSLVT